MRRAYLKFNVFLETEVTVIPEEDFTRKLIGFALMIFGTQFGRKLSDEEKERLYGLEIGEFQEELRKMANARKREIINDGHKQRVISLNEVESYIR